MKILWITNIALPDACKKLDLPTPVYGGWMYSLAADLAKEKNIHLSVATVYTGKELKSFDANGIQYYLLPQQTNLATCSNLATCWQQVVSEVKPDIVHIHGTEYGHGMALMQVCPNLRYIVSIQGLVSIYYRYFLSGLTMWNALKNITFRDILRCDTMFHKQNFYKRGLVEKEYIKRAFAVIGRTAWDYVHAKAIHSNIIYHHCNESLRDEFYTSRKWSFEQCERYSIFLSQANYPVKGLHVVLKAVALLKNDYPDISVHVAGHDITKSLTLKDKFKRTGYANYISKLVKKLRLEKNIHFSGALQADEMKAAYLKAHLFICPSSIENSPNSLGEAQITGTPCIASYVGGVPDMVTHKYDGLLYRFEEIEMLTEYIRKIFNDTEFAKYLSCNAIKTAEKRHDRNVNLQKMIQIYKNTAGTV